MALPLVRPKNHRDKVFAEELRPLLLALAAPTPAPLSDPTRTHGDLRRMQLCESGGLKDGVADDSHDRLRTSIFDV